MDSNVNVNELSLEELGINNPAIEAQQEADKETAERAIVLYTQARTIHAITGMNVLEEYENNESVRVRILNGEIDFIGLYREMSESHNRRVPAIVRSANGSASQTLNIRSMTDEQFNKLDNMLANGKHVSL